MTTLQARNLLLKRDFIMRANYKISLSPNNAEDWGPVYSIPAKRYSILKRKSRHNQGKWLPRAELNMISHSDLQTQPKWVTTKLLQSSLNTKRIQLRQSLANVLWKVTSHLLDLRWPPTITAGLLLRLQLTWRIWSLPSHLFSKGDPTLLKSVLFVVICIEMFFV